MDTHRHQEQLWLFESDRKEAGTEPAVALRSGKDMALSRRAAALCEGLGLKKLAGRVVVRWNPRMRTAAGRAAYSRRVALIELNARLLRLDPAQVIAEVERTFLHELAHLVAYDRNPRRRIAPHGPEWDSACDDLGIPGEARCHNMGFKPRQQKRKFAYTCPVCRAEMQRVRRMKGRSACLVCCREYGDGGFDDRFEFVERRLD